jgi:hypothetical protein
MLMRHLCIAIAGYAVVAGTAAAQPPAAPGDWTGVWVVPREAFIDEQPRLRDPRDPIAPALTAEYAAMQAARAQGRRSNSETCQPTGMPNVMRYPFAIEFLFTPGRVTILLEYNSTVRRIYTDGRSHSDDADPSYAGESIGRWEGDTLVVHTTAISPNAELLPAVRTSGRATVTERIRLRDRNHLQIETTVEDPLALVRPWRYSRTYEPTTIGFFDHVCLDNNRDRTGGLPDLAAPGGSK